MAPFSCTVFLRDILVSCTKFLRCQIEIGTGVCTDMAEALNCIAEIEGLRGVVRHLVTEYRANL